MSVKLALDRYLPKQLKPTAERSAKTSIVTDESIKRPLVILHGLFGNKQNWRSICKALATTHLPDRFIYAMDLRNHGQSPWTQGAFTYSDLAGDVFETARSQIEADSREFGLNSAPTTSFDLIGHSLGGKVSMELALNPKYQHAINRLVVVDMVPTKVSRLDPTILASIQGMKQLQTTPVNNLKKEADEILSKAGVTEKFVRQFLLTNYVSMSELHDTAIKQISLTKEASNLKYAVRVNVEGIQSSIANICDFSDHYNTRFKKDSTMFLYGTKSNYVRPEVHTAEITKLFPNPYFCTLETGHWVHSEDPRGFIDAVTRFLKN